MTPSTTMTPSTMIPSVIPTVSTVVGVAIAVAVGRISTAVTVMAVIYVVATLSRNQTKEE
jgi:hypothetical protein